MERPSRNHLVKCACGCGKIFLEYDKWRQKRRYYKNHYSILPKSEEYKRKIGNANRGRKRTEETKRKIKLNHHNVKGINNPMWNKKHPLKVIEKCRQSALRQHSLKDKNGKSINNHNYGKTKEDYEPIKRASEKLKGRRILKTTGDKNPNWRGGLSFEPYTPKFNKFFKETIKKRDGGCLICNLTLEDIELLKRQIDIHHINYDKKLSIIENCCTLCGSCHMKTNFNRNHWIKFFQSMLLERYNYKYTKKDEIILEVKNVNN